MVVPIKSDQLNKQLPASSTVMRVKDGTPQPPGTLLLPQNQVHEADPNIQVLDLSKPPVSVDGAAGTATTTETDAIHRRLTAIVDGGVEMAARSLLEASQEAAPAPLAPPVAVKRKATETNEPSPKKPKKATAAAKKVVDKKKKGLTKKKKKKKGGLAFPGVGGEDDFEIDPRLGGSKIKKAVKKTKGKDSKSKSNTSVDQNDYRKSARVGELRYPYIHVEGAWNSPSLVKIVNGHQKEEDSEGKAAKVTRAAQYVDEEHRSRAAKVGYTSTLSDRYDTHNRDLSWICVFCQQFTHMQCLGDLYGPYFVNVVEAEPQLPSRKVPDSDADTSFGGKKGKKSPLKKKTAATKTEVSVKVEPTVKVEEMTTTTPIEPTSSGEKKEVWFHESCLVWAPGVCLIPPRLVGLDEAIADSRLQVCQYCDKQGAHIFCRSRGCGLRCHFPCAVAQRWLLAEDTFLALCPAHKSQRPHDAPPNKTTDPPTQHTFSPRCTV